MKKTTVTDGYNMLQIKYIEVAAYIGVHNSQGMTDVDRGLSTGVP